MQEVCHLELRDPWAEKGWQMACGADREAERSDELPDVSCTACQQIVANPVRVAHDAVAGLEGLFEAVFKNYDDEVVIKCEMTAKDIRGLAHALAVLEAQPAASK